MKRLIVGLLATAACAVAAAPAGAAAGTLDQQQPLLDTATGIDGPSPNGGGGFSAAQTFTAGASGLLDHVELMLARFADTTGPLTVEIRDVAGGVPGTTVLAAASVPAASVPVEETEGFGWTPVPFASPALVAAGTRYALVVYTAAPGHYGWGRQTFSAYAGGMAFYVWQSPPSTAWGAWSDTSDLTFRTYVFVYPFGGFFSPVDNLPVVNTMKAGAAVPVKFSLAGDRGLGVLAAGSPASRQVACNSGDPSDAVEVTSTAGASGLQYDGLTDTYTYVWKTEKAWAGQCRLLSVALADGTVHQAVFRFAR